LFDGISFQFSYAILLLACLPESQEEGVGQWGIGIDQLTNDFKIEY